MGKKVKILFVNPSLRQDAPTKVLPVGLAAVMTFVGESGYKFDLLDIDINGYDDDYVEKYLKENRYDVFLAGSIVTHYKWMKWLTKKIRDYQPEAKIIIGNSVGGSIPEVFLRNSCADFVVVGEAEFTTVEILNSIRDNKSYEDIEGMAFINKEDKFIKTPHRKACKIDTLPMINWEYFDIKKYFNQDGHSSGAVGLKLDDKEHPVIMPVSTARGCAFKCSFCHYVFWDDPYRHRSSESILKEIKRNIEDYNATYIRFWDDLSFAGLNQAEKLVDAILESGLKFDWSAAIRADLFGHPRFRYERRLEVARKFKESGCKMVGYSLETGSPEILKMMNKRVEVGYFLEQTELLREAGIPVGTSVVFGYPIETKKTIKQTFDQCLKAKVYPSIGYLLPLPYTGMYDYAKKHKFIKDEDKYLDSITERQDFCLNMTQMDQEELMNEIKEGAEKLNRMLELNLSSDRLVKTGGYRNHRKETSANTSKSRLDPDNLKRNENDFSFNYTEALFEEEISTQIENQNIIDKKISNC